MAGYSYESRRAARQRKRAAFAALREQVQPLVQQGDALSLERAKQITAKYRRENSETPQPSSFMRKVGEAAAKGLDSKLDAKRQEAMQATGGKKRPGVVAGVAEAFPEEAVDRKVYDSPDPLGQKFAQTGAGGFLKEIGSMMLNAGRPGVGAVNAALQGDNPIGGAFREMGDVYDGNGQPLERYSALNNPGINRLPDKGIEVGPVNITPKTVAGFGLESAADWTSYVDVPGAAAVGGLAGKVLRRGGADVAEQVAKPTFLESIGQKVAPAVAGGAIGPKLNPMHPYSATQRLFNIKPPKQTISRVDRAVNALKGVLGAGVPEDDIATPIMRERRRVMRNVESQAARMGQVALDVEQAFPRDAKGRITGLPGEPTIQDIAARLPQYQQYLTPDQVSALQRLRAETEPFADALGELGVDVRSRADVMEGGFYLPRGNAAEEGIDAPLKVRSGRGGSGGRKGFEKGATFDSMADGINAGYEYASFSDAMQNYARDAGVRSVDQWTAESFKATGLGETAADRINPGLRAQVETLRAKIAQKRSTLIAQRARENSLRQGARDTGRMYENAADMATTAREQLAGTAQTAAKGEDVARSGGRKLEQMAAGQERAARETTGLAGKAGDRLRRLQERLDAVRNPKPIAEPAEGAPRETFSFQQIASSLPDRQVLRDQSAALRGQLTRDKNGQILRNKKNAELMRQIGEYDALHELHYAMERADGDIGVALELFDETLQREGNALRSRADPGLRTILSGKAGARARAAHRRASRQGFADAYQIANRGSEQDFGILSEQVRAMNDILEAGDFNVYETLDTPPKLGNAPTEEVIAAAKREYQVLLRESRKQERRSTSAWGRAMSGGDALQEQAQRNTQRAYERAESGARRVDRGMRRQERIAQRSTDRYIEAGARQDATGAEFDALRDQLASIEDDWRRAKEKALQTPRDQGSIGLAGLNGTTFPDELANVANKYLQAEQPISGRGSLPIKTVQALNGVLRGLRASADISFMGIQGLLGAVTHPSDYKTALVVAMKAAKDPTVLGEYMRHFDEAARAAKMPDSRAWAAAGLRIGGSDTEFAVGRGISGKIGAIGTGDTPVVKLNPIRGSNRMFGFFGDVLRIEAADSMARAAKAGKKPLTPEYLQEIGQAANLLTGYTDKSLGGETGQLLLFAPRFFASQLELVGRAMTLDPSAAGDEARTALIRLVGVGSLITIGINEARGKETDFKPGSSNFMRIRDLGGQDVSLFGPWDSLVRGIAATAEGDWEYIPRTKASPTVALVWDQFTGKTFTGEDSRTPEYFLRSLLPFSLSDVGNESPLSTGINSAGVKASPLSPREQIDQAARDKYQRGWGELTLEERGALAGERPDLAQKLADARQGKYGEYEDAKKRTNAQVTALNEQLLNGQLTREEWRDQISEANTRLQGARDQIFGDDQEPPDAAAQARDPAMKYLAIRAEFRDKKTGLYNEAAFDNALRDRMSASEIEAAFRGFGADDQPLQKLRSKSAREYYAIPRYQGFSAEQGQEIDRAWEQVLAITGNTDNRLKKLQALRKVEVDDPRVKMALYRRVYGHGLKLDGRREQWAKRNPAARPLLGLGRGAVTDEERKALASALGRR